MLTGLRRSLFQTLSRRVFYGWVILPVAAIVMFGSGPGQSHLIGLFFDPLSRELGLTRTSLAAAYGVATLMAAFLLPKLGSFIDKVGPVRMLWILTLALGSACVLFSFASNWIYVAIGFGLLRFLGQGSLMLNCNNMVSQWFVRKRGFALGVMSLGFPISMAVHPPLCQWLIEAIGWRETWIWLGISTWIILLPPILLFAYNKPEQVGLAPDGVIATDDSLSSTTITGMTRTAALRTPAFYIITGSLFTLSMLVTALHVENKGILMEHGLSAQNAASMFTVTGITAAITMPIVGRMLDHFRTEWMLSGGLIIMVASLFSVTLITGMSGAIIYALIFGINNAVTMTFVAFMWPRYFGRKHLGSIQGFGQMIVIVGASLGPLPLAIALDSTGSYDITLRSLTILPILLAFVALFLRPPKQLSQLTAPTAETKS